MSVGVPNSSPASPICLVLIGGDPIFQLGLQAVLEMDKTFRMIGTVQHLNALWPALDRFGDPDLFLFDLDPLGLDRNLLRTLCRQLKARYPQCPVVVFSHEADAARFVEVRQWGIEGYCPKSVDPSDLRRLLLSVHAGVAVWPRQERLSSADNNAVVSITTLRWDLGWVQTSLRKTSLQHLQHRYHTVAQWVDAGHLSWWQWVVLTGQLRELKAAQHFIEVLFPVSNQAESSSAMMSSMLSSDIPHRESPLFWSPGPTLSPEQLVPDDAFQTMKAVVLDRLATKLSLPLNNLTETPLEVDIFRADQKQVLFLSVLKQFEGLLDDLRFSQITRSQLPERRSQLLRDLWHNTAADFLGKYRTLPMHASTGSVEVVQQLLQEVKLVEAAILDRIPLFTELTEHFLFHSDWSIDRRHYPVGSSEAIAQTEALLGHVVVQVANAVAQPLINRFSAEVSIRHTFFDPRWFSTREIERFRNALSWQYRLRQWYVDPKDIFESQYRLIVFSEIGLQFRTIYAPRDRQLRELSGIPLVITLALEARDAIAPPLTATVTIVGKGLVYVLTQIIGRGLGLIGRGILQGVGYARHETRSRSTPPIDQQRVP